MAMMIPLEAFQNHVNTFALNVTYQGSAFNLAHYTTLFYLKASQSTPDGSATTITPTVINAALGQLSVTVAANLVPAVGSFWWRLDVIDQFSNAEPALFGDFFVIGM